MRAFDEVVRTHIRHDLCAREDLCVQLRCDLADLLGEGQNVRGNVKKEDGETNEETAES